MSAPPKGIVGRMVTTKVRRGDKTTDEVCEVIAECLHDSSSAYWRLLVALSDGALLAVYHTDVKLVGEQNPGGLYR